MIPTPREILIGRLLLHRARGEYDVAATLRHEIKSRDKGGGWTMPTDECPGELRSLVDLGFSLFACRIFERHGVVYAGDLARWSEAQLRSVTHLGTRRLVEKIYRVLQSCGLTLRDPEPGEPAPRRAPLARWLERRRRHRRKRRSEHRRRQIEHLLSRGISEREISRRLGYRSHTTVWAVKRAMRAAAKRRDSKAQGAAQRNPGSVPAVNQAP